jgi:hypothetical protein
LAENFKTPAMLRGFPLFRTGSVAVGLQRTY